jgi:hypothetical protein
MFIRAAVAREACASRGEFLPPSLFSLSLSLPLSLSLSLSLFLFHRAIFWVARWCFSLAINPPTLDVSLAADCCEPTLIFLLRTRDSIRRLTRRTDNRSSGAFAFCYAMLLTISWPWDWHWHEQGIRRGSRERMRRKKEDTLAGSFEGTC